MPSYKIYQVDAFADKVFQGNPAAVCPLPAWIPDTLMQQIAMENNLAETAFIVPVNGGYEIRWFTPLVEVDLCGHATLAAAFVLFHLEGFTGNSIHFHSPRSGKLVVTKNEDWLLLDFPADILNSVPLSNDLEACFDISPIEAYKGKTDYMLVFDEEDNIRNVEIRFDIIAKLDARGLIITAPGKETDFVSRFFGPAVGINEDPVTGSAHTSLIPYWADKLGKTELTARQLSARSGFINCRFLGERVEIGGKGKLYLKGEIYID